VQFRTRQVVLNPDGIEYVGVDPVSDFQLPLYSADDACQFQVAYEGGGVAVCDGFTAQ
jgi:hypothetical protein